MPRIIFGIGSNIGDRAQNLTSATNHLTQKLQLKNPKTSKTLQNKALLKPNSPKEWDIDFFNIAFSAEIDIEIFPPQKILTIIKEIEQILGRQNRGTWAPREIDIDILAISTLKINEENLKIPHQELQNRDFFLIPFKEIEPRLYSVLIRGSK